eukprot:5614507-Karenia_brevis.AAC.1
MGGYGGLASGMCMEQKEAAPYGHGLVALKHIHSHNTFGTDCTNSFRSSCRASRRTHQTYKTICEDMERAPPFDMDAHMETSELCER